MALATLGLASCSNTTDAPPPTAAELTSTKKLDQKYHGRTYTSEEQSTDADRIATTRAIRNELKRSSALSADAQNVSVVTTDSGDVYLRGLVHSRFEEDKVFSIAKNHASRVHNYLTVNP